MRYYSQQRKLRITSNINDTCVVKAYVIQFFHQMSIVQIQSCVYKAYKALSIFSFINNYQTRPLRFHNVLLKLLCYTEVDKLPVTLPPLTQKHTYTCPHVYKLLKIWLG